MTVALIFLATGLTNASSGNTTGDEKNNKRIRYLILFSFIGTENSMTMVKASEELT
jgi:hypothetical protein